MAVFRETSSFLATATIRQRQQADSFHCLVRCDRQQNVLEAIEYCQTHQELLQQEADAERRYLEARGVALEPKVTH
jgi:hypothetical protein